MRLHLHSDAGALIGTASPAPPPPATVDWVDEGGAEEVATEGAASGEEQETNLFFVRFSSHFLNLTLSVSHTLTWSHAHTNTNTHK